MRRVRRLAGVIGLLAGVIGLLAVVLGAVGSSRPAEGPEVRQAPAVRVGPRVPRASDAAAAPPGTVLSGPARPVAVQGAPASPGAPRAVAATPAGGVQPTSPGSRQRTPPSGLVRVQRAKPVTIKIRRTSKEEYAWELSGTNLQELLELDRRLRRELMAK